MHFADYDALLSHLKGVLPDRLNNEPSYTETISVEDFDEIRRALDDGIDQVYESVVNEGGVSDSAYDGLRTVVKNLVSEFDDEIEAFFEQSDVQDNGADRERIYDDLLEYASGNLDYFHLHQVEIKLSGEFDATIGLDSVNTDSDWVLPDSFEDFDEFRCLDFDLAELADFSLTVGFDWRAVLADLNASLDSLAAKGGVSEEDLLDVRGRIESLSEAFQAKIAFSPYAHYQHLPGFKHSHPASLLSHIVATADGAEIWARFIVDGDLIQKVGERLSYGRSYLISDEIYVDGLLLTTEYDVLDTLPGAHALSTKQLFRAVNDPKHGGTWNDASYARYMHEALDDAYVGRYMQRDNGEYVIDPGYVESLSLLGQYRGESKDPEEAAKLEARIADGVRQAMLAPLVDERIQPSPVIVLRDNVLPVRHLPIEGWLATCAHELGGLADQMFMAEVMRGAPNYAAVYALVELNKRNQQCDLLPLARRLIQLQSRDCLPVVLDALDLKNQKVVDALMIEAIQLGDAGTMVDMLFEQPSMMSPSVQSSRYLINNRSLNEPWIERLKQMVVRGCEPADRRGHVFGIERLLERLQWRKDGSAERCVAELTAAWLSRNVANIETQAEPPRQRMRL